MQSAELKPERYVRLLHPAGRQGSVTIARRLPDKRCPHQSAWQQQSVRIKKLPSVVTSLVGAADVYLTLNTFRGRRHTDRIAQIVAAFSDLDFHNTGDGRDPTQKA